MLTCVHVFSYEARRSNDRLHRIRIQFEITLCPALQKKPNLPSPRFEVETTASEAAADNTKIDPFAPPYNPQLHVGDLKDELTEEEFVILVSFHEMK